MGLLTKLRNKLINKRTFKISILLIGLTLYYFTLSGSNTIDEIDYKKLFNENKSLSDHGCICQNKVIRYGDFVNYDYDQHLNGCFIDMKIKETDYANIYCVASAYKMRRLLNSQWSLISDRVSSNDELFDNMNYTIQVIAHFVWNVEREAFIVTNNLIEENLIDFKFNTNLTLSDQGILYNNDVTISILIDKMISLLSIDEEKYLTLCSPWHCRIIKSD